MSKKRTVTRRYYSKKKQMWVEKQYTYSGSKRGGKAYVIVDKKGNINKKNLDKFLYQKDEDGNNILESWEIEDVKALTAQTAKDIKRGRRDSKLTTRGISGHLADTATERMLKNAGYTVEAAAMELGVSIKDLENGVWKAGQLYINNQVYDINFNYEESDSIFVRV